MEDGFLLGALVEEEEEEERWQVERDGKEIQL